MQKLVLDKDLAIFSVDDFLVKAQNKLKNDVAQLILKGQQCGLRDFAVVCEDCIVNVNLDEQVFGDYAKELLQEDSKSFKKYLATYFSQKLDMDNLVVKIEKEIKRGIDSKKDFSFFDVNYALRVKDFERVKENQYHVKVFLKVVWNAIDVDEV